MRALKQTGSRNIEAALEYISKMSYLDPCNERIVRVIKQTSPGMNATAEWIQIFTPYHFTAYIKLIVLMNPVF